MMKISKIVDNSPASEAFNESSYIMNRTVMMIDDDADAIDLYQMVLTKEGYRFLSAQNGRLALALLKEEILSPDLILLDCLMPKMNGEAFLKQLQKESPRTFLESKIIGLTCLNPNSFSFKQIKELAFDCREKPFSVPELLKIVSEYMDVKTPFRTNLPKSNLLLFENNKNAKAAPRIPSWKS